MLKVGTVFSGIGAIEHALKRMGIEYKISFACDNGEVDIFKKKININLLEIEIEINKLNNIILNLDIKVKEDFEYLTDLEHHLERIKSNLTNLKKNSHVIVDIEDDTIKKYIELNKINIKDVNNMINLYNQKGISFYNIDKLIILEFIIKKYSLALNIDANIFNDPKYKKIKKGLKEIVENLSMLYEKIETLNILSKLESMSSFKQKKKFVDNLYKDKEKSNFVKKSYFANYEIEEKDFHWNVSFLDGNQYRDNIDLFVGGSPCQSFSMVGKQRGLDDTRGTLFYEYARLVKEIQPKVFIYENVKAILSNDEGHTWDKITQVFNELGYHWKMMVLNAKDFSIPQNRERIFVVGFRNDLVLKEQFKEPNHVVLDKTMKDFLIDNVSGKYYLNRKGVEFVTKESNLQKKWTQIDGNIQLCQKKNQQFNWHGDFIFEEENKDKKKTIEDLEKYFLSEKVKKYVLSSGTKTFYSKPKINLDVARPLLTTMHKMHRAGIDNYVTTDGRIRKLTPRECLRLMGFCDSFKIVVSDTQIYKQAGNSIVVDVLVAIMKNVIKSLPQITDGENYKYRQINIFDEIAIE